MCCEHCIQQSLLAFPVVVATPLDTANRVRSDELVVVTEFRNPSVNSDDDGVVLVCVYHNSIPVIDWMMPFTFHTWTLINNVKMTPANMPIVYIQRMLDATDIPLRG